MKYFTYGIIGLFVITVIAGLVLAGSPLTERQRRFDEIRIQHLTTLQAQVLNFWQAKNRLPETLEEMADPLQGITIPRDPETGVLYDYLIADVDTFSLCAQFALKADMNDPYLKYAPVAVPYGPVGPFVGGESWQHEAGRHCFERTIDPDYFKSNQLPVVR